MWKAPGCGIVVPRFFASVKFPIVCHLFSLLSYPLIRDAAYAHINLSWLADSDQYFMQVDVWPSARGIWMEILLEEETRQSRLSIDDGSLVEILRGLGPTIYDEFQVARFVDWLEKRVSDHVPLMRGCA